MADNNMIYLIRWDDAIDSKSKDVRFTAVDNGLIMAESLTSFAGEVIREWRSPMPGSAEPGGLPVLEPAIPA